MFAGLVVEYDGCPVLGPVVDVMRGIDGCSALKYNRQSVVCCLAWIWQLVESSGKIHVLDPRDIPYSGHIKGETIHRTKSSRY